MIKKHVLISFGVASSAVMFIGCGGSDSSSSSTPTPNIPNTFNKGFNYASELAKAPQVIQDAMNSHPIQYVSDTNNVNFLVNTNNSTYNFNLTGVPTLIDSNRGYSFITLKTNNGVSGEIVYAWDKASDLYSYGTRVLSANHRNDRSFNAFTASEDIRKVASGLNSSKCSDLADFFASGTSSFSMKGHMRDNRFYFSDVKFDGQGAVVSLPDFDAIRNIFLITTLEYFANNL